MQPDPQTLRDIQENCPLHVVRFGESQMSHWDTPYNQLAQVTHQQGGSGVPLAYHPGQLLSYHLNHPQHDPAFVTLCPKGEAGPIKPFPTEMDNYLRTWFYAPRSSHQSGCWCMAWTSSEARRPGASPCSLSYQGRGNYLSTCHAQIQTDPLLLGRIK